MEGLQPGQEIVVRLNLVTMEWSGQLLLMGYRIFEGNNNNEHAVDEEVGNAQDQGVVAEVEVEEEQEGCEESGSDEVEQEGEAVGSNLWCGDWGCRLCNNGNRRFRG